MSNTSMASYEEDGISTASTTDSGALLNVTSSNTESTETDIAILLIFKDPSTVYWVFNVIVTAIGLIGNCMVFALMREVKFSLLSYPVYLKFLAVSDSAVLITSCIHESLRLFKSFYLMFTSLAFCNVWRVIRFIVGLLSPWLLVGLTLDRFFCVVFPLKRDLFCTPRKASVVCFCLTCVSVALMLPLLSDVKVVKGPQDETCVTGDKLVSYYVFLRLLFTSLLPCLLILVFTVMIIIRIKRSATFRKRFTSTSSGSTDRAQDKSLRPLMLISLLAFVTLLPSTISESVILILMIFKLHFKTLFFLKDLWMPFNILYLINFGQNFYILVSSSTNYRKIMKRKLNCANVPKRNENIPVATSSVNVSDISKDVTQSCTALS
ncbi:alpha-1A adrenergic receptor-like [Gigantopelta aegis]|uniref:alpha-1A adrenergic receptor-like n=1 Tax=Gigantopelta aegis TaxID=1735272 RepID=UPI001B88B155|nr:alpha-1A adrenergic receptor-like [Gigantopelta aegis]